MNIATILSDKVCSASLAKDVIKFEHSPFLFLGQIDSAQKQLQRFLGEEDLKPLYVERYKKNLAHNIAYITDKSIKYHHIVFPAKIPSFAEEFSLVGLNVSPIFGPTHESEHVSYPLHLLKGNKHFLVQDTHNNDNGKILLINYLLTRLDIKLPQLTPIWKPMNVVGDMGKRLSLPGVEEHRLAGFEELESSPMTFSTASALNGNSGQIFFTLNESALFKKRILLFGDSFIHSCVPLLSFYFREVIYFRTPYIMKDISDNLAPDYIVTSSAERYLAAVPDSATNKPYFVHYFSNNFQPQKMSDVNKAAFNALFAGRESHEFLLFRRDMMKRNSFQ